MSTAENEAVSPVRPGHPASGGRTPVMADVARLAGVSHQTVSRVINGQQNLRPETRRRVEEAIAQLGYRPNSAARALVTRRSGTIGVIGTKAGYWGPTTVHRAIQAAGRAAGYFVSSVNLQELTRDELTAALSHLRDQDVEGVVVIAGHDEALAVASTEDAWGVPLVVVEGDAQRVPLTVGVDQVLGGRLATEHLLDRGHIDIVHIAGPQTWAEARGRLAGYHEAMYAAGLRPAQHLEGNWSARSGYEATRRLLQDARPTGIFCANDQTAIGVLRALFEAGARVPDDVAVVGFDDIPEAGYLIPPLTTVRQDFTAVGQRAIDMLRSAIGGETPSDVLIEPTLVVRASSGESTTVPTEERPTEEST